MSNLLSSLPSLLRLTLERDHALSYRTGKVLPQRVHPYASPWPDALPALGPRTVGPFEICSACSGWSWVRYGGVVLCLPCALAGLDPDVPKEERREA